MELFHEKQIAEKIIAVVAFLIAGKLMTAIFCVFKQGGSIFSEKRSRKTE